MDGTGRDGCPPARTAASAPSLLAEALVARRDVLGERLLAAREGPSYAAVSRALPPLWYAVGHGGLRLTRSGAYYLAFAYPRSLYGEKAFALHVADGSAIVTRRSDGPSLTVLVGDGREVYGSCVARLGPPRLARGWLPVLRTRYVDARGVRYAQESFAGRVPGIRSLVSFVRLTVDARRAGSTTATVRFAASPGSRARLVTDGRGAREHDGVRYGVRGVDVLRVAWAHSPSQGLVAVDETVYDAALQATERFWGQELANGVSFHVPERRVLDAERSLLVQQRILTWRYSVGNPYEELSFAEALDVAEVMAATATPDVARRSCASRSGGCPAVPNWRVGSDARRSGAATTASPATAPTSRTRPARSRRRSSRPRAADRTAGGSGLLRRSGTPPTSPDASYGLHAQAIVWQGLLAIGASGRQRSTRAARPAPRARPDRLGRALRAVVRASQRRLPDGSLFVPAALLDGEHTVRRAHARRATAATGTS